PLPPPPAAPGAGRPHEVAYPVPEECLPRGHAVAASEHVIELPPAGADLLRPFPPEAAVLPTDVTVPVKMPPAARAGLPYHGDSGLNDGVHRVDNPIAAGEHVFERPPASADRLRPVPPGAASLPTHVTV